MKSFAQIAKIVERFTVDNSPALLTAVGVAGTVGTAVLSGRAALRYDRALLDIEQYNPSSGVPRTPLTGREKAPIALRCYAPTIALGTITVVAIVGANHIGTRRAAAVAAAYTLAQEGFDEYKHKVVERLGEGKERAMRDEIAQERVARKPSSESNVVIVGSGDVLCYDMYTDRYFNSSKVAIDKAVNEVNHMILTHGYASLSDFYDQIDIPHTSVSDEMGWTSDKLLEINFSYVGSEDGRPCVAIDFQTEPVRNYHRFH